MRRSSRASHARPEEEEKSRGMMVRYCMVIAADGTCLRVCPACSVVCVSPLLHAWT